MKIIIRHAPELLILIFLIVTFLQSGIDKITDWEGNLSFIKGHFKNSPLRNFVPPLLVIIVVTEITASLFMIYGIYEILATESSYFAILGFGCTRIRAYVIICGNRTYQSAGAHKSFAMLWALHFFGSGVRSCGAHKLVAIL